MKSTQSKVHTEPPTVRRVLSICLPVVWDVLAVNLPFWLALCVRPLLSAVPAEETASYMAAFWRFMPFYTVLCLLALWMFRLYGRLRKADLLDVFNRVLIVCVLTGALYVACTLLFVRRMPVSVVFAGLCGQLALLMLGRVLMRAADGKGKAELSCLCGAEDIAPAEPGKGLTFSAGAARPEDQRGHPVLALTCMLLLDAVIANGSYVLALVLRYFIQYRFIGEASNYLRIMAKAAPIFAVLSLIVFYAFRFYQTMWEYAGMRDAERLVAASAVTAVIYWPLTAVLFGPVPRSIYVLGPMIQICLLAVSRFGYKLYLLERNRHINYSGTAVHVMVVGAGSIGRFACKQIDESGRAKTVCVVDCGGAVSKRYLNGVPVVCGLENIEKAILRSKVGHVVIAEQRLTDEARSRIAAVCGQYGIEVEDYLNFLRINDDAQMPVKVPADENARVIPFSPPDLSEAEMNEVMRTMKSGWITTGPRTKELEKRLAAFCHTSRAVCLSSATAAEELNLRICGIGEGDEVIVPAYTYTATASAVIHCGAKVVFVDSMADDCEPDYDKVAEAITPRTKAVIAVDLGGVVADYDRLFAAVEQKKGLFVPKEGSSLGARIQQALGRVLVFADSAHSLGASRNGKMAGEIADFTSFSFHAVKNFTTAEGGASTWRDVPGVDNDEIYRMYQLYSLHGQSKDALAKTQLGSWEYDIVGPWYKCNMTDIMAAIGLRQLDRYPGLLQRRKAIIARYDEAMDALGVKHLRHDTENGSSSGHLYITRVPGITDAQRREIIIKMAEAGVSTNVHYKPLPMMTAYRDLGWDIADFPNARAYYDNLITLPLHTRLSDEDVRYVIDKYTAIVKEYLP